MTRDEALRILGLDAGVSTRQVRSRFHELALVCHPDTSPDGSLALERFLEVKEAYALLVNAPPAPPRKETRAPSSGGRANRSSRPRDKAFTSEIDRQRVVPIRLTFEESMTGKSFRLRTAHGHVELEVPPGTPDGGLLRRSVPVGGGNQVTIVFAILVSRSTRYRRAGNDLFVRAEIAPAEAQRGTTIRVRTPWRTVDVHVEPYSRHGNVIRVPSQGVPSPRGRGDLYVELADTWRQLNSR